MGQYLKDFPNLTFTGTSTVSNAVGLTEDLDGIAIYYSSSTGTTFTVQVALNASATSGFGDLQSAGSDITITASEIITISPISFRQLRLLATGTSTGTLLTAVGTFHVV